MFVPVVVPVATPLPVVPVTSFETFTVTFPPPAVEAEMPTPPETRPERPISVFEAFDALFVAAPMAVPPSDVTAPVPVTSMPLLPAPAPIPLCPMLMALNPLTLPLPENAAPPVPVWTMAIPLFAVSTVPLPPMRILPAPVLLATTPLVMLLIVPPTMTLTLPLPVVLASMPVPPPTGVVMLLPTEVCTLTAPLPDAAALMPELAAKIAPPVCCTMVSSGPAVVVRMPVRNKFAIAAEPIVALDVTPTPPVLAVASMPIPFAAPVVCAMVVPVRIAVRLPARWK